MRFTGARAVLQVHPTRRCNLTCAHCYSDSSPRARDEIALPVLQDLVVDAASLGYDVLAVSGGEPFMYPSLPGLLRQATSVGMNSVVTTNGTLIDARRLDALGGCLDLLVLSLDGPRREHDLMRGKQGLYDALGRSLKAIRLCGIPFGFLFTLTQRNVHQLEWAAHFAADNGACLLQVHPLEPCGRGRLMSEAVPDAVEAAYALLEIARLRNAFGAGLRFQLDLSPSAAFARFLGDLVASDSSASPAELSAFLSPLVVEPDGACVPLTYGFVRSYSLGTLYEGRLTELVQAWTRDVLPGLHGVARDLACRLTEPGAEAVVNGYEVLARAALATTG